jgi:hypothetical protein
VLCPGPDSQPFSFTAQDGECSRFNRHAPAPERVCQPLQPPARLKRASVLKPVQIDPLPGKRLSQGLVRYIHLNPLRAGVVKTLGELDRYRYCGHGKLMGKCQNDWQETKSVPAFFADRVSTARRRHRRFVEAGAATGRRPDLIGGGLVRSAGGWQAIQEFRKAAIHQKSDERTLGDGEFVEEVLARAEEALHRKYASAARGVGIEEVMQGVSELTGVPVAALTGARSLLCYWAVTELGMSLSELAGRLGIAVSTVSGAVQRGAHFAERKKLRFTAILNVKK